MIHKFIEPQKFKYIISLHKDADKKAFEQMLKNMGVTIKTKFSLAPIFVVLATDKQILIVKKMKEVKTLEDEFKFISLHPPANY